MSFQKGFWGQLWASGFGWGAERFGETWINKFRGAPGLWPGVPEKRAAQAECYRVFDKKVERASREMKRGLWPE